MGSRVPACAYMGSRVPACAYMGSRVPDILHACAFALPLA